MAEPVPNRANDPKRKIFIANSNGDWWEHAPGQKLYVLDTSKLHPDSKDELNDDLDFNEENNFDIDTDKFHHAIWEHGTEVDPNSLFDSIPKPDEKGKN
jgi:hypothetical protein